MGNEGREGQPIAMPLCMPPVWPRTAFVLKFLWGEETARSALGVKSTFAGNIPPQADVRSLMDGMHTPVETNRPSSNLLPVGQDSQATNRKREDRTQLVF